MTELNDKELFDSAISDAPVETVEVVETETAEAGPVRDEMGRFAPKEQAEQPIQAPPAQEPVKADEAHVPSWRLREVNEQREAAERRAQEAAARATQFEREMAMLRQQMASQQKPQEQLDPWSDLPGYLQQSQTTVEQRLSQARMESRFEMSETLMRDKLGDAKFEELRQWGITRSQDPAFEAKITNAKHPWAEVAKLQKQEMVLSQIGDDPDAYRNKLQEDLLKNPEFLAKAVEAIRAQGQPGAKPNIVQLPPSLNRATSAASPHEDTGDLSDRSLYAFATR